MFRNTCLFLLLMTLPASAQINILWDVPLDVTVEQDLFRSMKLLEDGSILIWGGYDEDIIPPTYGSYLYHLDNLGNELWGYTLVVPGELVKFLDVVPREGGYVVALSRMDAETLVESCFGCQLLNSEGNLTEEHYVCITDDFTLGCFATITSDRVYFTHANPFSLAPDPQALALTIAGDSLWSVSLFGQPMDNVNRVQSMRYYPEYGLVVTGMAGLPGLGVSVSRVVSEAGTVTGLASFGEIDSILIVDALEDEAGQLWAVLNESVNLDNRNIVLYSLDTEEQVRFEPAGLIGAWGVETVSTAPGQGFLLSGLRSTGAMAVPFLLRWFGGQNYAVDLTPFESAIRISSILRHPNGGFLALYIDGNYQYHLVRFEDFTEDGSDDFIPRPSSLILSAYPNPFNPTTTIRFDLPVASRVVLDVFNIEGQKVTAVADRHYNAGTHALTFDGSTLASGLYFARLQANAQTAMTKLMLVR